MALEVKEILSTHNIEFKECPNDTLSVFCPFHNDQNTPNGLIFLPKGTFWCNLCRQKGQTLYSYLARKLNKTRRQVYIELNSQYETDTASPLNSQDVNRWHEDLWKNDAMLKELRNRCVTDETIREYRLGAWSAEIISIPVFNASNEYINIRRYKPGAKDSKFSNLKGSKRTKVRIFPIDQLQYDEILICGGECKALAALSVLNEHGIGAVAPTCGEHEFPGHLIPLFDRKIVYVCSDIDTEGLKSQLDRCRKLKNTVEKLYAINLPLDEEKYPKGDINNFLFEGGDLLKLIRDAPEWELPPKVDNSESAIEVDLDTAISGSVTGKKISLDIVVSSMDTSPYSIPRRIEVKCTRDQDFCSLCDVYITCKEGEQILEISPESIEVIEMVNEELRKQNSILKKAFNIPNKCLECTFDPIEYFHIEDTRVSQQLDIASRTTERSMQIAYFIKAEDAIESNEFYSIEARQYPHPKNQQASLLISDYTPTQDALATFVPKDLSKLEIFQPELDTEDSIQAKLNEIYEDLEANVTRIYKRREMHLMIDLAYHSPLFIDFDNSRFKGWVEVLILGDSGQGKSQTIERMAEFYGLGEIVSCKNTTVAGLMGGLQQYGKRWFTEWGKFPTHDRRLLALEELKGASIDVIGALTHMRSSGRAEVVKIEKRMAHARTRLIAFSNPRPKNRVLSSYNYGIDAVVELIGALEDLRRFDAVLVAERNEVDVGELQQLRLNIPHQYTSELCRELILWNWTIDKVKYEDERAVFKAVGILCKKYVDDVPIIDRGSMRDKICRLSAALAGRLFSIEDEETVLIKNVHIEFITSFLDQIYSKPSFGYDAFSKVVRESEKVVSPKKVMNEIKKTRYPSDFVREILQADMVDLNFICDIQGYDPSTGRSFLSMLVRHKALKRDGKFYRKTIEFTSMLKDASSNGTLDSNKPQYIQGDKNEF